jgi:hypothetical protein
MGQKCWAPSFSDLMGVVDRSRFLAMPKTLFTSEEEEEM